MESTSGASVQLASSVKRHAQLEQLVASERLHPVGGRAGAMAAAIFQLAAEDTTDADQARELHQRSMFAAAVSKSVVGRGPAPRFSAGRRAELRRRARLRRLQADTPIGVALPRLRVLAGGGDEGEPSWPAARRSVAAQGGRRGVRAGGQVRGGGRGQERHVRRAVDGVPAPLASRRSRRGPRGDRTRRREADARRPRPCARWRCEARRAQRRVIV